VLARLARFLHRRRVAVLVTSLVLLVGAVVYGGGVASELTTGGFEDPAAESSRAAAELEDRFGTGDTNLVVLVTAADGGTVDDPDVVAAAGEVLAALEAEPEVEGVVSYWSLGNAPPLRSGDGTQALALGRILGDEDTVDEAVVGIVERYTVEEGPVRVGIGGEAAVFAEVGETIESDLVRAELIALPITLLLLVLIFGSLVAAGLPLGVGIVSVLGTFAVLQLVNSFTDVSVYALNLTTALGLGLAIDYSLFIVSRFREELHHGWSREDALARTLQTAGRTVLFSGLTVAVSLAALLVFPLAFLRSFAWAGMAVVALAAIGSIIVLPAALAVLGPRIDRFALRTPKPRSAAELEQGFWHRLAMSVMRRPIRYALGVLAFLLLLGAPFLHVQFGLSDDRVLPEDAASRQVQDDIRANFSTREAGALEVVALGVDPVADAADVDAFALALSTVDGVARVDAATGIYQDGALALPAEAAPELTGRFVGDGDTWFSVVPDVEPLSPEGEAVVHDIRDLDAPFDVLVAGRSAELVDAKDSLFSRIPLALGIIAVVTFVVMFLLVGSILVPLKAIVLNLLSLTATFGAMVWIFQDGNLADLLGFTPTGTLEITMPILMFCIAFGLSMDYEVFLLSRIKEEHDRTGDNERSVAAGIERTGRIITAAALLLGVVFLAFATSDIAFIKMFGLGLALAVLMDATLVRGLLVPAFMRLAGEANWWAPAPLRRLYERLGLAEKELDDEFPPVGYEGAGFAGDGLAGAEPVGSGTVGGR
jgi:RND superfamily putative drug exporter